MSKKGKSSHHTQDIRKDASVQHSLEGTTIYINFPKQMEYEINSSPISIP